jgi:tripartite-type tricarboxylate transporter receptor subunit TctC
MKCRIWAASLAAFMILGTAALEAQEYPSRVIRAVLPFSPGGLGDTVIRAIGHGLGKTLGQGIVVENRPGAGTQIGAQACAAAPPDGYTICMLPVDALSYQPFLTKNLPYDPDKSFEPITAVFYLTEVMVVAPATSVATVEDLIARSKVRPNTLNYATTATSSVLFFENFKHETGADITKVVYKGGADAVQAMLGGESEVGFFGLGNVVGQIQSGALRALAVDGLKRSPLCRRYRRWRRRVTKGHKTGCGSVCSPRPERRNRSSRGSRARSNEWFANRISCRNTWMGSGWSPFSIRLRSLPRFCARIAPVRSFLSGARDFNCSDQRLELDTHMVLWMRDCTSGKGEGRTCAASESDA